MEKISKFTIWKWTFLDWFLPKKMFVYSRLRLFWNSLWIRKDEFHSSLNMDHEALMTMNDKQRERYMNDLVRRREIAHRKGIKEPYKHLKRSLFA